MSETKEPTSMPVDPGIQQFRDDMRQAMLKHSHPKHFVEDVTLDTAGLSAYKITSSTLNEYTVNGEPVNAHGEPYTGLDFDPVRDKTPQAAKYKILARKIDCIEELIGRVEETHKLPDLFASVTSRDVAPFYRELGFTVVDQHAAADDPTTPVIIVGRAPDIKQGLASFKQTEPYHKLMELAGATAGPPRAGSSS